MAKNNKKTAPEQVQQTQQSEQGNVGNDSPKAEVKASGKMEKIAKSIFSEHTEEDIVHITSDGFGYFNEHDARNHARTLPNDDIVTITRQ